MGNQLAEDGVFPGFVIPHRILAQNVHLVGLGKGLHLIVGLFSGGSQLGLVVGDQGLEVGPLETLQAHGLGDALGACPPKGALAFADQFEEHRRNITGPPGEIAPSKAVALLVLGKPLPHELAIVLKIGY